MFFPTGDERINEHLHFCVVVSCEEEFSYLFSFSFCFSGGVFTIPMIFKSKEQRVLEPRARVHGFIVSLHRARINPKGCPGRFHKKNCVFSSASGGESERP